MEGAGTGNVHPALDPKISGACEAIGTLYPRRTSPIPPLLIAGRPTFDSVTSMQGAVKYHIYHILRLPGDQHASRARAT